MAHGKPKDPGMPEKKPRASKHIDHLRKRVRDANVELHARGLAPFTFGNASAIDRDRGIVVIKPSGVPYAALRARNMVVTDLEGKVIDGTMRPSSDLPTHIALYRAFPEIGAVVHTHSPYATAWAQAAKPIPCLGTTHADYFEGDVPVTRTLSESEISGAYEHNTGVVIAEGLAGKNPLRMPAILVAGHAPFAWARTIESAVETMHVLEMVAHLAYMSMNIGTNLPPLVESLRARHFNRKHGPTAYYGQA
jgi:L-ribulose-5-phosphate 4-epimerase